MDGHRTEKIRIGGLYYLPPHQKIYDTKGDNYPQLRDDIVVLVIGTQAVCDVACIKLWWIARNKFVYILADWNKMWYCYESEVENGNE